MNQKFLLRAGLLLSLSVVSCALMTDPGETGFGSFDPAKLTVQLDGNSRYGIVIDQKEIVYASVKLTDPNGAVQIAEWTPGGGTTFVFSSPLEGYHLLEALDVDAAAWTNTNSVSIYMRAGYNYYVTVQLGGTVVVSVPDNGSSSGPGLDWLSGVQDRYLSRFSVYDDASSAANNFHVRGYMGTAAAHMAEDWTNRPRSGVNCIRASVDTLAYGYWAGCYFLNGYLQGMDRNPRPNWGEIPDAGINLAGATKLTFWARGETGTETVEFYCLGIGRDTNSGAALAAYPDSSFKLSTGWVTLTTEWKQYTINLQGRDLGYVLGGFGWSSHSSPGGVVFYLDDISYDLASEPAAGFPVSYRCIRSTNSFDIVVRNTSYVYDASLALMAFLSSGQYSRARRIADALVYAQDHDRFYTDGRLRNAYQGGQLTLPPGWKPNGRPDTVRMPGFWDSLHENWYEDEFAVSTSTGNIAWAMLALLSYYQICGGPVYLESAKRLGDWVIAQTRDTRGAGGFMAGKRGWDTGQTNIAYKSTEHNLDLYAAFLRLYDLTGASKWADQARHASNFVMAMWNDAGIPNRYFFTGTLEDGVTIFELAVPTDCQPWVLMAFHDLPPFYREGLDFNEAINRVPGTWGFDFSSDKDGIWYEGTAQMALGYALIGQESKYNLVMSQMNQGRSPDGAIYASDVEVLTTGFANLDGSPWFYFRREHVGATAWDIFARRRVNPFWLGSARGWGTIP